MSHMFHKLNDRLYVELLLLAIEMLMVLFLVVFLQQLLLPAMQFAHLA